jgi:TetR/AcrR family transcriptional repressor of nem operon
VLRGNEEALTAALIAARERGEITADKDPGALGGFLGTFITGLRVAAKTNPDEGALMRTVEVALSVLD